MNPTSMREKKRELILYTEQDAFINKQIFQKFMYTNTSKAAQRQ